MFTIKKQATGSTWHLLSEMDKEGKLSQRRARDKKRKQEIRQDLLMINYVKAKYPIIYKEASEYYSTLNAKHPTTSDLRKTWRFKEFISNTKTSDDMVLEIPLTKHKDKETPNHESKDHEVNEMMYVDDIFPDINLNTLVPELSPQLIEEIIKDLRADPDMACIMNDVEDQMVHEEADDLDIDINIPDDLLEKELAW